MKRGKCRKATKGARPPRRRRWQTKSDGKGAAAAEVKWLDGMKMKVKTIEIGNEKTTTLADFFKIRPLSSFARIARKIHSPQRGEATPTSGTTFHKEILCCVKISNNCSDLNI